MKTTTRLSLLLLIVALSIVMLARVQESATFASAAVACHETGALAQRYAKISALPIPDPRNLLRGARARDKSILWRVNLALQLMKRSDLNQKQAQIILDAISLSTPEFFAATSDTPAQRIKANEAFESLKRRALSTFPKNRAVALFSPVGIGTTEADILKMYFDISALPLKKRRTSFRNSSPADQSNLWKTHLALFLVKRPELNEWQKAVILSAMSLASREFFEVQSGDSAWKAKVQEPSRSLEAQIVNAFSLDDAAKIFATLGDDADLAKSSASVLLKSINYKPPSDSRPYKQLTHSRFAGQDTGEMSNCECSTSSDYCSIWSACGGGNCRSTRSGCGTLWRHACNGGCR